MVKYTISERMGTRCRCHANVSIFKHPEYGDVWISMGDITERKRAEEALRR